MESLENIENMNMLKKQLMLYSTVFSSAISSCNNYIALGNNCGHVCIFTLAGILSDDKEHIKKPLCTFQVSNNPVYTLITKDNALISGGFSMVVAWSWSDIIKQRLVKLWSFDLDDKPGSYVNSLAYNFKDGILYGGTSSGTIEAWDLVAEKKFKSLVGHQDYVHDICLFAGNGMASVSEDGSMRLWDCRSVECCSVVEPYTLEKVHRQKGGKYLSCVTADSNGDWLVCGGGPKLTLFRRSSTNIYKPLEEDKKDLMPNVVTIFNDEIIAGGDKPSLYRWHINGEKKAIIPSTTNSIFTLSSCENGDTKSLPLVAGGADHRVSVFTNLGYQSSMLTCL